MSNSSGTIYNVKAATFHPALIRRRDNAFYRRGMAIRYAKQLKDEKVNYYDVITDIEWSAYRLRLIRAGVRYKSIPTENGGIIVMSENGGTELPNNFHGRVKFLDDLIAAIPKGRAVGGTRGFGGSENKDSYNRKRGNFGNVFLYGVDQNEIATMLEGDGIAFKRHGDIIKVEIEPKDLAQYIVDALCDVWDYSDVINSVLNK